FVSGVSGDDRLAAVESAEPHRAAGCIADGDGDVVHIAAELIGDNLREHGPRALAHGCGAGYDVDGARDGDADLDFFVRASARAFDRVGQAYAKIATLFF